MAEVATGTVTADGSEQTLSTQAASGVYQAVIDLNNLAGGATPDIVEIRVYLMTLTGGTSRQAFPTFTFVGGVSPKEFVTPPLLAVHEYKITLKQTQGTNRTFPWSLRKA